MVLSVIISVILLQIRLLQPTAGMACAKPPRFTAAKIQKTAQSRKFR